MVAFSGGADSAFLLAAAVRALGPDNVAAATAYSDSLPASERGPAQEFARVPRRRGARRPRTAEMEREGYRANDGDRCAFCKAELLDVLGPLAGEHGYDAVATGTNADDARAGFRPGIARGRRAGGRHAAADAGLTKEQVRAASRALGPADVGQAGGRLPELAGRLRHRDHAGPAGPGRAGRGGAAARRWPSAGHAVANLRVRDLGDQARIEVDRDLVEAAGRAPGRGARRPDSRRSRSTRSGFRSGSMNERLAGPRAVPLNSLASRFLRHRVRCALAASTRARLEQRKASAVPTGKVKWYDAEKGFGFLSREDGDDVYVRSSSLPEGVTTLKAGHPRRVRHPLRPQGRPGPPGAGARRTALGLPEPSCRAAQEARGDGRHRRGPDPAARGRRARATAPAATPTPRPPSRPPSCCAASPTSSSSEPARGRSGRRPAPRAGLARAGGRARTRSRATIRPASTPSPSSGSTLSPILSGSAMPMNAADHPGQLQQRLGAGERRGPVSLGHVALDGRVQRELAHRLGDARPSGRGRSPGSARRRPPRPRRPRRRPAARPRR